MRIAYFDCFSGISGDMILGAFLDAGFSISVLRKELKKLTLTDYTIRAEKSERNDIWGTQLRIRHKEKKAHRHLADILSIIDKSTLSTSIKLRSKDIFERLAQAEAKIHNKSTEEIHFHEVGAVDCVLDVVGAVIGIETLGIEKVYSSPLNLGTGFLECAHGTLPVPAPATLELTKNVPVYSTGINSELVTPTGAAVITSLASAFGEIPSMKIERVGYGVGSNKLRIPNVLRVFWGEMLQDVEEDRVKLIETNIDDMNPEFYDYVMEDLLEKGAKDVYFTPTHMKKNRPGIILSIVSPLDRAEELTGLVFRHTTSLGVRVSEVKMREKLHRETEKVSTRFGTMRVKLGFLGEELVNALPEYEDCKRVARKEGMSIKVVYNEVLRQIHKNTWQAKDYKQREA